MSFITPSPPVSLLGRHRILSPKAAVRVSPLCLGGMNFGEAWKATLGECSKETAFAMLDYFYEQGGNFIDTAVNYQFGESELWIGEWMKERVVRDEMVLATKFTGMQITQREKDGEALRTSYVDIYYVHLWGSTVSIPELMNSLNDLVTSRKVLYLGISDTPAWIVVKANCYAHQHGLRQFSVYQGRWSAADRSFERETISMALDEGMALAPWGAIGAGSFKTRAQREKQENGGRKMMMMIIGNEEKVSNILEDIANAKIRVQPITSVALAYVMHKSPYVFPIVGGRKVSHLEGNIEALGLILTSDEIQQTDAAYGFEMGFPHNFLNPGNTAIVGPENNRFANNMGLLDHVKSLKPIAPHQEALDANEKDPEPLVPITPSGLGLAAALDRRTSKAAFASHTKEGQAMQETKDAAESTALITAEDLDVRDWSFGDRKLLVSKSDRLDVLIGDTQVTTISKPLLRATSAISKDIVEDGAVELPADTDKDDVCRLVNYLEGIIQADTKPLPVARNLPMTASLGVCAAASALGMKRCVVHLYKKCEALLRQDLLRQDLPTYKDIDAITAFKKTRWRPFKLAVDGLVLHVWENTIPDPKDFALYLAKNSFLNNAIKTAIGKREHELRKLAQLEKCHVQQQKTQARHETWVKDKADLRER